MFDQHTNLNILLLSNINSQINHIIKYFRSFLQHSFFSVQNIVKLWLKHRCISLTLKNIVQSPWSINGSCHIVQSFRSFIKDRFCQEMLSHRLWTQKRIIFYQVLLSIGNLHIIWKIVAGRLAQRTVLIVLELSSIDLLFLWIWIFILAVRFLFVAGQSI